MSQLLVPDPLSEQTRVNQDVVCANSNLPGRLVGEERTKQIADIAQEPLYQEIYGQAGSTLEPPIFVDELDG